MRAIAPHISRIFDLGVPSASGGGKRDERILADGILAQRLHSGIDLCGLLELHDIELAGQDLFLCEPQHLLRAGVPHIDVAIHIRADHRLFGNRVPYALQEVVCRAKLLFSQRQFLGSRGHLAE